MRDLCANSCGQFRLQASQNQSHRRVRASPASWPAFCSLTTTGQSARPSTLAKRAGHQIVAASNGSDGLKKIEAERFDLLIVDIFMPGMDGLETIQKVHQQQPKLPVVVMSGMVFRSASSPPPDFLAMATKLGAVRSLRKPFRPHELLAAVDDSLIYLQTARRLPFRNTLRLGTTKTAHDRIRIFTDRGNEPR